ncbi:hypothetical protein AX16_003103 [Volvariella volvacea WC 439]|nr:hypothetical protein AX16_003103 [Volvariella volvacea WC 439]
MRLGFRVLLPLLGAISVFAAPSSHLAGCPYSVKQSISPPRGWERYGVPSPGHSIDLRIGLPQPNFATLERQLYKISNPEHERYGQHLSKEEVEELVAPHLESLSAVDDWLSKFGIEEDDIIRSPAKDWIKVTIPVGLAEKMLDTTYYTWRHSSTGEYVIRTTSYSLPTDLHRHVDVVQPTTMFGLFQPFKSTLVRGHDDSMIRPGGSSQSNDTNVTTTGTVTNPQTGLNVDASCNVNITISCLQQLYNAVGYTPSAHIGNSIGITGYLEEFANIQDLQTFYSQQRPDALGSTFNFISVNGGLNNQALEEAGEEAGLDVQFAFGLSYPIPGTFYSTAGRPPFIPDFGTPNNTNEPYADWLDFVLSHPSTPLTISTSYGDDEQTVPEDYARRVCSGFAQLGARGVSVIFSSGDRGVGDGDENPETQTCFTNDGRNATRFIPSFPASCPYVTSVGGTVGVAPEIAVTSYFSGGGFSDYFPRPAYQNKGVKKFLKTLPKGTYAGLFNPAGRVGNISPSRTPLTNTTQGIPDVAAQGDNFRIIFQGRSVQVGGTSASAPTFAGIVALLNDARLKAGKRPLGFLNPLLYTFGVEGLTDILEGHNSGCGTPGFNVTTGWDPVTGLGTPNFRKLKDIVLKY